MKLQLREAKEVTVLTVHETVAPMDVSILKAGLGKLAATGKQGIILDLLAATPSNPETTALLRALPDALYAAGTILLLALPEADENRLEEFKSVEDAMKGLATETRRTKLEIRMFEAANIALDHRKKTLEAELKSLAATDEAAQLRSASARARRRIRFLETRIAAWMSKAPYRGARPSRSSAPTPGSPELDLIFGVLEQSGILKGLVPTASAPAAPAAQTPAAAPAPSGGKS